jgi:hypothetical protein
MSRLRIKLKKKVRRRGDRLEITIGDATCVYQDRKGEGSFLVEYSAPDQSFTVEISPCERFALMKGQIGGEPAQMVLYKADANSKRSRKIAVREADGTPWFFPDPADDERAYVSMSQTGIRNAALLVASVTHEIDHDLAKWLRIAPDMCPDSVIEEFHENPRWRDLIKFEFRIAAPTGPIGKGRRAENTLRHKHSNYDAMLREGAKDVGGILYPEQFETLRKGVDLLVADAIKRGDAA